MRWQTLTDWTVNCNNSEPVMWWTRDAVEPVMQWSCDMVDPVMRWSPCSDGAHDAARPVMLHQTLIDGLNQLVFLIGRRVA